MCHHCLFANLLFSIVVGCNDCNVRKDILILPHLWFHYMWFQALDRGENLTILADKTETLRSQVSRPRLDNYRFESYAF